MLSLNPRNSSPRRALLDLAPLELDCMNTFGRWAKARCAIFAIASLPRRPRAYTTIMTIMDRLARKGVVERRKVGRAYLYRPNLSAEEARAHGFGPGGREFLWRFERGFDCAARARCPAPRALRLQLHQRPPGADGDCDSAEE